MKTLLTTGVTGVKMIVDLQPEWMCVGYGSPGPGKMIRAVVAAGYTQADLPLARVISHTMKVQRLLPTVALFDDSVQLVFEIEHVTPEFRNQLRRLPNIAGVFSDDIASFTMTGMAETFPDDPTYRMFHTLFNKHGVMDVALIDEYVIEGVRGQGAPFDVYQVSELKREAQQLI